VSGVIERARSVVVVFAAMALVMVMPIGGVAAREPDVEGVAAFAEECGGETSVFTLTLEGNFNGCLYTEEISS